MITIFNRKELTIVNTMGQQVKIRDLLAAHNIRYYIKVFDRFAQGHSGGRVGSFGTNINVAYEYEYKFYVHKDDYEMAQAVLSGKISN